MEREKQQKGFKMLYHEIGTFSKEEGKKIVEHLEGESYYNFHVGMAPIGACYSVFVESTYEGSTQEEFVNMVIFCLACALIEK